MPERGRTRPGAAPPRGLRPGHRARRFDWLAAAPYVDAVGVAASVFGGMTVTTRAVMPRAG